MYFCPGACHAPHHAPKEWIDKYKGKFDMGYEKYPRARLRAPEEDGHLARTTPSSRRSTRTPTRRASTASRGRRSTSCARGTRCPTTRRSCSAAWPRSMRASCRTPTTRSGGCSTTSRRPASSTTRSSCSSPTTAPRGEGGPNGSVNENKFFNGIPDDDRGEHEVPRRARLARRPTTTTRPAGPGRSTRRSRCGSATTSKAASPTR